MFVIRKIYETKALSSYYYLTSRMCGLCGCAMRWKIIIIEVKVSLVSVAPLMSLEVGELITNESEIGRDGRHLDRDKSQAATGA